MFVLELSRGLLSDAKVGKDGMEHLGGSDLSAGDFPELINALAEILTEEVAGELLLETFDHTADALLGTQESLVVAGTGDDDIVLCDFGDVGSLVDGLLQLEDVRALFGTDGQGGLLMGVYVGEGLVDVHLVSHDNQSLVLRACHHVSDFLLARYRVDHPDDDGGFRQLAVGALYAETLYLVCRAADACRVDEAEGETMQGGGVLNHVACGAVDVADDGLVLMEQLVEQGALAHVGLADDGHGNATLDGFSFGEGVGERRDFMGDGFRQGEQLLSVGEVDVLVAEVQFQFEQRRDLEQFVAEL